MVARLLLDSSLKQSAIERKTEAQWFPTVFSFPPQYRHDPLPGAILFEQDLVGIGIMAKREM
jgi:hypothetical protein